MWPTTHTRVSSPKKSLRSGATGWAWNWQNGCGMRNTKCLRPPTSIPAPTYHNHFVVNSIGLWDGRKFNCGKRAFYQFHKLSDDLCREYHLSTIQNPKGKTPRSIYFAERNGEPTRYNLMREAVDAALCRISSMTLEYVFSVVAQNSGQCLQVYSVG